MSDCASTARAQEECHTLESQAAGWLSAIADSLVLSARRIPKVQKSVDLVDGMARGIADANEGAN